MKLVEVFRPYLKRSLIKPTYNTNAHSCWKMTLKGQRPGKFMFSKKATKIDEISTSDLTVCIKRQI